MCYNGLNDLAAFNLSGGRRLQHRFWWYGTDGGGNFEWWEGTEDFAALFRLCFRGERRFAVADNAGEQLLWVISWKAFLKQTGYLL